jgi:hypothetical protein
MPRDDAKRLDKNQSGMQRDNATNVYNFVVVFCKHKTHMYIYIL